MFHQLLISIDILRLKTFKKIFWDNRKLKKRRKKKLKNNFFIC